MAEHKENDWLTYESPQYTRLVPKWKYVLHLLDGTYIDTEYVDIYLIRRPLGEAEGMHKDRKANLDPDLLFSNLLSRISGQFFNGESKLEITWQPDEGDGGFGDPQNPETVSWQLLHDTDGSGANLDVWMQSLLDAIQAYERVYVIVKSPTEEHGPVYWQILTPDKVPDEKEVDNRLVEVKIRFQTEKRDSLMDGKPKVFEQLDLYQAGDPEISMSGSLRRWEWEGKDVKEAKEIIDDGKRLPYMFEYFVQAGSTARRLPVVRSYLPFRKYLAYLLAKKAVALLNKESERDNYTRVAFTPFSVYKSVAGPPKDGISPLAEQKRQGFNHFTIHVDEELLTDTVPMDGVDATTQIIKDKRTNLFISASQTYEDEAKQVTATSIRQHERGGRVAHLTLLGQKFDEVLQECLLLTEQIQYPGQDTLWGKVTVARKGAFKPDETESEAERDKKAFFGEEGLPLISDEAAIAVLRQQYEARGVEPWETFEDDVRRWHRMKMMLQLIERGMGQLEAARAAGLEGKALSMMTRTDDVLTNGEV